jgi:hypothetical protein
VFSVKGEIVADSPQQGTLNYTEVKNINWISQWGALKSLLKNVYGIYFKIGLLKIQVV